MTGKIQASIPAANPSGGEGDLDRIGWQFHGELEWTRVARNSCKITILRKKQRCRGAAGRRAGAQRDGRHERTMAAVVNWCEIIICGKVVPVHQAASKVGVRIIGASIEDGDGDVGV